MKVLQLSKFFPPVMGGIESVAWELAEGLNRSGIRADVLCSQRGIGSARDRADAGYDIWRAGCWGTLLSTSISPSMLGLLAYLRNRYDCFHVHMPDPMAAAAVWALRPRGRVVVHWHSDVIRQRRALKLYAPLQQWLLQRADAVISTSTAYADASDTLRPWRRKVQVVPIGISDNRGHARAPRAAEIRRSLRGRRMVFSLGRMTYYKGFDVLIDAAVLLPDDCVVLIGGEGELLESFRRDVIQRGLVGKVQFLGSIADDELPSYFEACDVFCMPSTVRAEAYGVAIVEAMVMGKPIVATDIAGSGVPWVNTHGVTGFNVPVRDAAALAAALRAVLGDDALRRALGEQARRRYEAEFSAALMTRRTLDLYRSLDARH